MSEKTIPKDTEDVHTPSKYLRWRVDVDELAEISSLKMQGYWRKKDTVEFVDYLMQLGKKVYVDSVLPYEAGDQEKKQTGNDATEPTSRAAIG